MGWYFALQIPALFLPMKTRALLVVFAAFLVGCSSSVDLNEENVSLPHDGFVHGKITSAYRDQGCAFLFEYEEQGQKRLVRPFQLEEQYKIDGLEVKMKFSYSRIMNEGCDLANPVIIDSIVRINP
ncbi:MAG: hypothetical protein A3D92_01355 [Bacteroidetes bacterium RIFCSPHIGHO2_02_FULL_44_7]|nr:MAG: hypothetical protein A3D92_01355 [Bacteroidetes bacterium RIFCSPHIGHO2_02_FULL_44_7]